MAQSEEEEYEIAWEMSQEVHEEERSRWREEDLAYDGSAWPMRRELTPRERDILTRILDGWWHRLIELDAMNRGLPIQYTRREIKLEAELLSHPAFAWMRMSPDECQLLLNLRNILTPRQD